MKEKERSSAGSRTKRQFLFLILAILVAMVLVVLYSGTSIYRNMTSALMLVGENSLAREKEQVNAYLQKSKSVLEVSAVVIDQLIKDQASSKEAYHLLKMETDRFAEDFDENYTGIYGYAFGEYIDGTDWVPPQDYIPKERDWYVAAKEAAGETVISSPYVDAMTGKVIISISKMLSDNESVVSMDITLDEVQRITEAINLNNYGYGLISDERGLIIAHSDATRIGALLSENEQTQEILSTIVSEGTGHFETVINGKDAIVFHEKVMDDWYAVMIIASNNLYRDVFRVIWKNTIVCVTIFLIVALFVAFGFHRVMLSFERVEESNKKMDNMFLTIVRTLAQAIDAKDKYTNGHSQRVGAYSKEIALRMGKSEKEASDIYYAALLHDVGKIRIPDTIINKKGKLTDEEYSYMKLHPVSSYHILKYIKENPLISQGAKDHHERYDGKGYPNGFAGENISEVGRIIAVADAYDAMTSNRSYRSVMEQSKVREQIEGGKGTQFDAQIADIMLAMIDEDTEYTMRQQRSNQKDILIVDDDVMQHDLLEYMVRDEPGYHIKHATSGAMAIEMVRSHDVDVILLDVQMPEMDGFETYEKLKDFSKAQVVFLTGERNRESVERAYRMGGKDYLVKPFTAPQILEVLHNLLQEDIE